MTELNLNPTFIFSYSIQLFFITSIFSFSMIKNNKSLIYLFNFFEQIHRHLMLFIERAYEISLFHLKKPIGSFVLINNALLVLLPTKMFPFLLYPKWGKKKILTD